MLSRQSHERSLKRPAKQTYAIKTGGLADNQVIKMSSDDINGDDKSFVVT